MDPGTKENLLLLAALGIGGFITKMVELGWGRLWFVQDRRKKKHEDRHAELEQEIEKLRAQVSRATAREKQLVTALEMIVEIMKVEFDGRNANLIERVNKILRNDPID